MLGYLKYFIKRLCIYVGVVLFAIIINFMIPRMIPGNPLQTILAQLSYQGSTMEGGSQLIEEYKRMFGLDKDLATQFIDYLIELFKGNLGYSILYFPAKVQNLVMKSLPWTIYLLSMTVVIGWVIGTILGAVAGWRGGKLGMLAPFAILFGTIPYYILALLLIFLFVYWLGLFPTSGAYTPGMELCFDLKFIVDVLWHSALPALSIIISSLGWWFLGMRSMMRSIQGEDFLHFARAKGIKDWEIMLRYALRNAVLPQITGLGLSLGNIMGGALLTEVIFAYPGLGYLYYTAIINLDYTMIQGLTVIITLSLCGAMLILELVYPLIDPRISRKGD